MKWNYKSEMRTKALLKTVLCRERMPHQYSPDSINGIIFANSMQLSYELLSNKGGKQYFISDGNYDNFYFLTNDEKGEAVLKLICYPELLSQLNCILKYDLEEPQQGLTIENDAIDENGNPVLFCYTFNLPKIIRFNSALQLYGKKGILICFDYQADLLKSYCCDLIEFQTIDFEKCRRRFLD